jgi:transcriptional regulator with XRE-family HTH domain
MNGGGSQSPWEQRFQVLANYLRTQREAAGLTLRELAERADVSNAYLSQLERGLHEPSIRVLSAVAVALDISGETLLALAGLPSARRDRAGATERAIRSDPALTAQQRTALLGVYRSYTDRAGSRSAR